MVGRPPAALVGRDDSLGVLKAALRRASAGHPSVLIVTGETGVGKTRLVRELIETERVTLLAGSCVPMAGDPLPFAPLTQALRRLDRTGTLNLQLERLPELARLVPGVAPAMTRTADLAAASQLGLFQSVLDLVDRLGAAAPVLHVVEDVHWADRSTLDLVRFLATNLTSERAVLLVTLRPTPSSRARRCASGSPSWPGWRSPSASS
jgi:predicted ATPase